MTRCLHARRSVRCLVGAVSAVYLAYFAVGCAVEPPSAPSTDFVLSFPIANDSTRVIDIVDERGDFLQINEQTGGMNIRISREVGRADVGDRLSARPTDNSFSTPIGNINIPGQEVPPVSIAMSDLLGQDIESGTTLPLVPASAIDVSTEVPLENVTSLNIEEGGLEIAVDNGLPLALDGLRLSLVDLGNGGVEVDAIDIGTVAANGGVGAGSFSLAGKSISGNLAIAVTGATAQGANVTIEGNPSLDITVTLSDLIVSQALAIIPQQEFADAQVLVFPDDRIQVTRAVIQQGGLILRVTNDIEIVMELELSLDDLLDANGNVNTFIVDQLIPGETREIRFDLDNNEFVPENPLELRISYTVRTFPSNEPVQIFSTGELRVEAITEDLVFERVEGRLNRVSLPLPEVEREINFPDGLNNVELGRAAMDLYVTSGVAFLANVNLLVRGVNKFGQTAEIDIQERFERGSFDNPVTTVVTVTRSELTPFINLLPSQIAIGAEVVIGDGQEEELIRQEQWVSVDSVVFRSSPRLSITDTTRIDPEVRDITFRDTNLRNKILSNFRSARVITDLENSIPLGVGVRLFVGRTPETVYTNPVITIPKPGRPPFQAVAAPIDADGYSNGTESVRREIELDAEDVAEFILKDNDRGGLYSGVRITFPATGSEVEVLGTDFINIIAGLQVELLLDDTLVE